MMGLTIGFDPFGSVRSRVRKRQIQDAYTLPVTSLPAYGNDFFPFREIDLFHDVFLAQQLRGDG